MSYYGYYGGWAPYVSVAERRRKAAQKIAAMKKKGQTICPIEIEGRVIASSFWGKSWCENLESYSDFENRLPRGRTYVRNGSVVHLGIEQGRITAMVSGSELYTVKISVKAMPPAQWKSLSSQCAGKIESVIELLQGKLSRGVMELIAQRKTGLFPSPREITLECSCPDHATMCKHVAAVLYGVGARLDREPELLFALRQVEQEQLVSSLEMKSRLGKVNRAVKQKVLKTSDLSGVFGIDLEPASMGTAPDRPARRSSVRRKVQQGIRPGDSLTAGQLLERGIPRSTFQNWFAAGVLVRTKSRGVYRATRYTESWIERALGRI